MSTRPATLDSALVEDFVTKAHADADGIRALLGAEPGLANASWDWGGGDWETGLGAAAHMGRRDIALLLLEHGARIDVFAAAMLGYADVVRDILSAQPAARDALGPHGIPLVQHARAGGEHAAEVRELLETPGVVG